MSINVYGLLGRTRLIPFDQPVVEIFVLQSMRYSVFGDLLIIRSISCCRCYLVLPCPGLAEVGV